jgi:oligopeptidase A
MTILKNNPLLIPTSLPAFKVIDASHVEPAVNELVASCNALLLDLEKKIAQSQDLSWDALMSPLDDIERLIERVWGPVGHLLSVKNSDELRKAFEACQPKIVQLGLHIGQSRALYDAFNMWKVNQKKWQSLPKARQRIVDQKLLSARMSGVALEGSQKDRFTELSKSLSQIKTTFSNQVLDATKIFRLELHTKDDILGLTSRILAQASSQWNQTFPDRKGDAIKGPWLVTLDVPSYLPFMEYSENRKLKEQLYRARMSLASTDPYNNTPLIDKILEQRQELANLVGFKTYAEMSLAEKMAGHFEPVMELLEDLRLKSYDYGVREHQELQSYAKSRGFKEDLLEWDLSYWARRMKEDNYDLDEDKLREYFPVDVVLDGLFLLVRRLFGVDVKKGTRSIEVWHDDVMYFDIFDGTSKDIIAGFYLDLYARPAVKRGGAWMNNCVTRARTADGLSLPVAYLICNGTPAHDGKPPVMGFDEVRTLFHEFGHGLQHMLTKVEDLSVSGISGVEWDCVELASQFMENWLYHAPTLKSLTKHVDTGTKISDDLIHKIIRAKNYRVATQMLRQIHFSLTDLELHHKYTSIKAHGESCHDVSARIAKLTSVLPPRPESRMLCSFSHIFAGGYAAGYYSYKWAEVLSADAFSAFEEAGLDDDKALTITGRRYRDTVLALGGSDDPMAVFVRFRGRKPTTDALLKDLVQSAQG